MENSSQDALAREHYKAGLAGDDPSPRTIRSIISGSFSRDMVGRWERNIRIVRSLFSFVAIDAVIAPAHRVRS